MAPAAAPEVWFYHLERSDAFEVLPQLLDRTLSRGWRAVVRSPFADRLRELDGRLWTARGVLPHGLAGGPHDARQPILLMEEPGAPNGAEALFLLDGAEAGPLDGVARALDLFNGRDPQAVAAARTRWRTAKAAGAAVSYWKQTEAGSWVKQA